MDSKVVIYGTEQVFFLLSVVFPRCSCLAFNANDSSNVFKLLIGKVVAKPSSENKHRS